MPKQTKICLRMCADETGNSMFLDEAIELESKDPDVLFSRPRHVQSLQFLSFKAGSFQGWHCAPRRQYIFQLEGEIEIEVSSGEKRRRVPGDMILVEDTHGQGHITRIISKEDVLIAVMPCED